MDKSKNLTDSNTILQMSDIVKDFPGVRALDKVNFDLNLGEVHALVGENGAGKSTLIKVLTGVYKKDHGLIKINGKTIDNHSTKDTHELGIACIYQELNLVPDFDVAKNIFLGIEPVTKTGMIDWKRLYLGVSELLDELGVNLDIRTPIRKLGMGERQMVLIARALLRDPKVLILDEPTAMLTRGEIKYLFELLKKLKRQGVGIIYITHRMEEVFEISDRITIMRDGTNAGTLKTDETNPDEVILSMVGRKLEDMYPKVQINPGKVMLEVSNISNGECIKNVSFSVSKGEVLGIYGVLGSGTTEVGQAIVGDIELISGNIKVNGSLVEINNPRTALKNGLALIPKDRREEGLILSFSVKENMTLSNLNNFSKFGIIKNKKEKNSVEENIGSLSIQTSDQNQLVRELSGGNQQKVVISKAMLSNSKIFIFDEPTRGVDVGAKVEIYKLISKLLQDGASIVIFSSELSEILNIADRVIVLFRGVSVFEKAVSQTNADELLMYALKGEGQIV